MATKERKANNMIVSAMFSADNDDNEKEEDMFPSQLLWTRRWEKPWARAWRPGRGSLPHERGGQAGAASRNASRALGPANAISKEAARCAPVQPQKMR